MSKETIVKQGDLFPDVFTTVRDENGAVVDVTGCTVKFFMRNARSPTTYKVDNATGAVDNGPQGKIKYTWAGTDTDTPATYEAEWKVTPPAGDAFRVPTTGYETIIIEAKIGA